MLNRNLPVFFLFKHLKNISYVKTFKISKIKEKKCNCFIVYLSFGDILHWPNMFQYFLPVHIYLKEHI